jgi:GT2 family glycosyltransferase
MTEASSDGVEPDPQCRPVVAVVVPTHNRVGFLEQLVADLEAQAGIGQFEAVIVDDSSSDATWDELQRLRRDARFPLSILRTPKNIGPAAARNLGWRDAKAPLVAFTDDDCRPDPTWLARLVDALKGVDVVQGQTRVDPTAAAGRGPFARIQIVEQWSDMFDCCNMGYRRTVLEQTDGFDEDFRRPWAEDADLGWRAVASGATTGWAPDALVWHRVETAGNRARDWVLWVKETRRKFYMPLLVKKHPQIRDLLHHRWFYMPHHPPTLLAIAGLAALTTAPLRPSRWLVTAVLFSPWAWHRGVTHRLPARLRWLPILLPLIFVGDAAEVSAVAAGAVHFRSLLL